MNIFQFPSRASSSSTSGSAVTSTTPDDGPQLLQILPASPFAIIEKDRLTAKYSGPGGQYQDAGSVLSDNPFAGTNVIDYFEVLIVSENKRSTITVGVSTKGFLTTKLPGWDSHSFGYHGHDGRKYSQAKPGKSYGPSFDQFDIIGCGIVYSKRELFFTKNGKYLGPAFYVAAGQRYYPTVGMNLPGERIRVNFGQERFHYDITPLIEEERKRVMMTISDTPAVPVSDINHLIKSYLLYAGFKGTLEKFEQATNTGSNESMVPLNSNIDQRRQLLSLIQQGKIANAIERFEKLFPKLFQECRNSNERNKFIMVRLYCQEVIEHLRCSNVVEALEYAQKHLATYFKHCSKSSTIYNRISDTLSLFGYENAEDSPASHLMQTSQRDALASDVNTVIMESLGHSSQSSLEGVIKQLLACKNVLKDEVSGVDACLKLPL